ncbi:hypothetical protein M7I_5355 [Glarea lozoyensis 74030]|uniref:Uncharacterized protein n=1 Tax=Glarea lozoyensis (strain ATCC 74030 / MF5533) TaxID=1104152 RepID=H0ERN4_GLAL7|nr:hypothetical protein M7I_5355 [Glarea lozoyensis 74030]
MGYGNGNANSDSGNGWVLGPKGITYASSILVSWFPKRPPTRRGRRQKHGHGDRCIHGQ